MTTTTDAYADLWLDDHHLDLIIGSAISPEVARERGYRTSKVKAEQARLGFKPSQRFGSALLLPVWDVRGENRLSQLRPDEPRIVNGKPLKYEQPAGSSLVVDVPRRARAMLLDPHIPLFITEGIRKADAAVSAGLCCIDLLGVWGFRGRNIYGGLAALGDWAAIPVNRDVFVAFDSDVMLKQPVHQAMAELAKFLRSRSAVVHFIYLPTGDNGRKVGLDDFFAAGHDKSELMALATDELLRPVGSNELSADIRPIYRFTSEGLVREQGERLTWLANFEPKIIEVQEVRDASDVVIEREYIVSCRLPAKSDDESERVTNIRLGTTDTQKGQAGVRAAFTGQLASEYQVDDHGWWGVWQAAEALKGDVRHLRTHALSGWVNVPQDGAERLAFLLPSGQGAITAGGLDASVRFHGFQGKVPDRYQLYGKGVRPAETEGEYTAAEGALREVLNMLPAESLVPILDLILGAPLGSLGMTASPPLIHIYGQTGQLKTSSGMALLNLLGGFTGDRDIPESWSSTVASLQQGLHVLRDLPLLVDDYKTVHMRPGDASRLVQNYADGTTRSRMSGEQERRESLVPQAFLLSTGEERWEQEQSSQARVYSLPFPRLELGSEAFKERSESVRKVQQHALRGDLGLVGGSYLRYLARLLEKKGRAQVNQKIADLREQEREKLSLAIHARVLETLAGLRVIEHFIGEFIKKEFPALHAPWLALCEENTKRQEAWLKQEAMEAEDLSPIRQLLAAIQDGLASGQVRLEVRGVRSAQDGLTPGMRHLSGDSLARVVGYFDSQGVFLTKNVTWGWYLEAQRHQGETVQFSWNKVKADARELLGGEDRQLFEAGGIKTVFIPHSEAQLVEGTEDVSR